MVIGGNESYASQIVEYFDGKGWDSGIDLLGDGLSYVKPVNKA